MEVFAKAEHEFLLDVGIDYVPLNDIVRSIIGMEQLRRPTRSEFLRSLDFIAYLFKKYGNYLKCLEGPDMQQRTEPLEELLSWLKEAFYAGKYTEIHYGIWFDLDRAVIPPAYIPPPLS